MWDNLKQEGSVEDYIKAHDKIQQLSDNQVQANQGFVRHAFIQNLKPRLAKFIWDKDYETIKDTYQEAWNAKQKAKFTSRPNNGNNNSQSNNFNSCGGNNNKKRKKFTNNSYANNCQHQTKEKSKFKSKGKGACLNTVSYSTSPSNNKIHISKSSSSKSKTSKDTLIYYPFLFHRHRHKLLLDTGAKKSIFSFNSIFRHNLPTFTSKINHLILANSLKVTVKTETLTINIRLGHLDCKIKGIVCPNLNVNIIAGLNWLRQLKPVIDWESSVLLVLETV